jgi:tetratricopeptide (TPR) repeat protein
MVTETNELTAMKRRLMLRDSFIFISLIAITVVLFLATYFLFRSFQTHRAELAKRWAGRGSVAFHANHPKEAIQFYRTALSYAPGERSYELMLAEALGQAGQTEESYNYFVGLWDAQPGDGFINLQLARLVAKKQDVTSAINFYRASIDGTWEGDGVERRREVRLELARYMIAHHQLEQARTDLLIAAGNGPNTPELDITFASLLEQAGAPLDALRLYQKALAEQPKNLRALSRAGHLAYAMGNYALAGELLERAVREQPDNRENSALLQEAKRILELQPAENLPMREQGARILAAREIARKRFTDCAASLGDTQTNALQDLQNRWAAQDKVGRSLLLHDSDQQKATLQLVRDTEIDTSQLCGVPTGDDALLLLLARSSQTEGVSHF